MELNKYVLLNFLIIITCGAKSFAQAVYVPNDPEYNAQWHLGSNSGINAGVGWTFSQGDNVVIAILDTGVDPHPDLVNNTLPGYDFVDNDTYTGEHICWNENIRSSVVVDNFHGTHVAGVAAAVTNNNTGGAGVAFDAKILPVRVLDGCGQGEEEKIIKGIRWAIGQPVAGVATNPNPAKVINLSLGSKQPCNANYQSAIDDAIFAGTTVVVSAGNSTQEAADFSPANCSGVISVAASDENKLLTYFSNFGNGVDITAPGEFIRSTYNSQDVGTLNDYSILSGTSQAAPQVSGVAALLYSVDPSLAPWEIKEIIQDSAQAITCPKGCGAGLLDASAAVGLASETVINSTGSYGNFIGNGCSWILQSNYYVTIENLYCGSEFIANRVRHSGGCSLSTSVAYKKVGTCSSNAWSDNYKIVQKSD